MEKPLNLKNPAKNTTKSALRNFEIQPPVASPPQLDQHKNFSQEIFFFGKGKNFPQFDDSRVIGQFN